MKIKPIEPVEIDAQPEKRPASPDEFDVTENDDGSVTFPLPDGTIVTLRDILTEDLLKVEQAALKETLTNSAAILKIIELICTKWGETKGFDRAAFIKLPFRQVKPTLRRLTFVLKEFFRIEDLLSNE